MERRYEDLLLSVLDKVNCLGSAVIPWWQVYQWWNVEKVSKTPYRSIWGHWEDLLPDEPKPKLYKTEEGILILQIGDVTEVDSDI